MLFRSDAYVYFVRPFFRDAKSGSCSFPKTPNLLVKQVQYLIFKVQKLAGHYNTSGFREFIQVQPTVEAKKKL